MRKIFIAFLTISATVWVSCQNEADPEADKSFFTKFYDDSRFDAAYTPLDVAQTTDGGYIVLALKRAIDPEGRTVDPGLIYIMKTDGFGAYVSKTELDASLVTPAPSILQVADKQYFFCMSTSGLATQLVEIGADGKVANQINVGGSYPLAAGVDGTNLLLLNYDVGNKASVMSVVTTTGQIQKSQSFTIGAGDGPEEPIMNHILRTGRQLPFQVGKSANGQYFFNGFYNYTLSLVFTDLNTNNPSGVVQGNQEDGGFSGLLPTAGGKFAAARFNYGDNYLLPSTSISRTGVSSSVDLGGLNFPELEANAHVVIVKATVNSKELIVYGGSTRSKQMALYGYASADGTLAGSRYIGFSNSFELAAVEPTNDDGLIVLGTTYIAGRFPRICLFKLSSKALGESFH